MAFNRNFSKNNDREKDKSIEKRTVSIRRVSKVTQGGKRLRFSALVVCGDKKGKVGVGLGRGADTRMAVEKATTKAEKTMKQIQLIGDTIPHEIDFKYGAARIILRPARPGTGVIAGSSVKTLLTLAGVENVYAKQIGSNDIIGNTYCVFRALLQLRSERVLSRMKNMQGRIEFKEKLDAERKVKENKRRAKMKKEGFQKGFDKNDRFSRSNRPSYQGRDNKKFGNKKVENKPVEEASKVDAPKADAPKVEVPVVEEPKVVLPRIKETNKVEETK